ncbi:MAG TPA: LysR family transcriptional regulator [Bordetella sp.]
MNIRQVDLNLLPVLDALLRHQSVTLAARELDMSQSSLSAALARLRTLLDDELLVRTGHGMQPTARATALAGPLASLLGQLRDDILTTESFAPRKVRRRFSICLSDVGSYVLWPQIVRAVRAQAPLIELRLRNLSEQALELAIERGEADLIIGAFATPKASLFQRRLYERAYVCVARAHHPYAGTRMTLRQFANARHIVVRTSARVHEQIDQQLRARHLERSQITEIPSYLLSPPLLESDDYLAVIPGQLADVFDGRWNLVTLPVPLALPMSTIRMWWHRRANGDPGNLWLRQLIAAELGDGNDPG